MEKLTFTIKDNGIQVYRNQAELLHNPVGPAVIHPDGCKSYWLNGKRHNEDGPAIVFSNGDEFYYLNDKSLSKEEWEKQVSEVKEVTMTELHELLGCPVKIKED